MKAYSVPGLIRNDECDVIANWAKNVPENGVIVEIGSFFGKSAVAFAESAPPSVQIFCIDFFDQYEHHLPELVDDFWQLDKVYNKQIEFKNNTKDYSNVTMIKLEKPNNVLNHNFGNIDLLFIDAGHKNPTDLHYIEKYRKQIKSGGLLCGHDYHEIWPDVVKNVNYLEKVYKVKVTTYTNTLLWSFTIP